MGQPKKKEKDKDYADDFFGFDCFAATVSYGDAQAPQVRILRNYRDLVLVKHRFGRALIALYWRLGPPMARWLRPRPTARALARLVLAGPTCYASWRLRQRYRRTS